MEELWRHHKQSQYPGQGAPLVSDDEIKAAIKALNTSKAADEEGLVAEHCIRAGPAIIAPLQCLISQLLSTGTIPEVLKTGRKIPFPKKNKDPLLMGNHRGISITPVLGKILEHVIQAKMERFLPKSDLQFGFTAGCTPTMVAVCITEALAGASPRNPLVIITLDVEKAFDTVDHQLLRQKIFQMQTPLNLWSAISSIYDAAEEHVVLNGFVSNKFIIEQGV